MAVEPLQRPELHPQFVGDALDSSPPPYDFEGVTLRYFPLKANYLSLTRFCDSYLNLAPEIAYFRPAMPFVLLVIVNYGRMSPGVGNLGWTSQNELLFSVPLEWYRREGDELVFQDFATVAPFIFVDNESSQAVGREVLGWPKVQGWFSRDLDAWARHPRARREVLTLSTRVFEELYEDEEDTARELLVVEEEPIPTFSQLPPKPGNPLNPLVSIPKALVGYSDLALQVLDFAVGAPLRGYPSTGRGTLAPLLEFLRTQKSLLRNLQGNTINLKQMRDAGCATAACYQALTNAKMEITQFRQGGLLGDWALLRGDFSGGFRVRINRFESQPIIEELGLEVDQELTADASKRAYLKPVMPFWQELDLRYQEASNICWRTAELDWRTDEVRVVDEEPDGHEAEHEYNTTGPAGLQVATGPFDFLDVTLRVLPLLADPQKLQSLVTENLANGGSSFEVYGRYVYMVITNFGPMYSETNDLGNWADKTVDFLVPVRRRDLKTGELLSVGFHCPFMFNNSTIGVTTGREVYGWPVIESQFSSPRSVWLEDDGPIAGVKPYLDLKAEVFPALNVGQSSEWRTILEIGDGNLVDPDDLPEWQAIADGWGRELKEDVIRMAKAAEQEEFADLRALTLEILANRQPINHYAFKQFRDARSSGRACYQALVQRPVQIDRLHDLREMENPLHVKIHRYPTHPIVEKLGLVVQNSVQTATSRVDCLQPSRQFFLKADLRANAPSNLCWRSLEEWRFPEEPSPGYFSGASETGVGRDLVRCLDGRESALDPDPFADGDRNPQNLQAKCSRWEVAADEASRLSRARASRVVADMEFEPQMAIHAMLSAEWGNMGNPRWRQHQTQLERNRAGLTSVTPVDTLPPFVIRRDSVGAAADSLLPESGRVANAGTASEYWSPNVPDPDSGAGESS